MFTLKLKFILTLLFISITIVRCQKDEERIYSQLDGKIVFVDAKNQVKSANINSLSQTVYHGNANSSSRPKWSNDGTKFAYIFLDSYNNSSYFVLKIIDYNTGNIIDWEIGNSRYIYVDDQLSWSPDDKTIIFLGKNNHINTIIYLNTLTGDTIQTHFNLEPSVYCTALAWHPTEEKIAVNIQNWHIYSDNTIWMVEPFENTPVRQFPIGTDMRLGIEHMDWNSNGIKLSYSFDDIGDLFIVNADGSENKEIPDISGMAPCWSRDGNFIIYIGITGSSGIGMFITGIFVTDINGTFEKLLLKDAGYCDWY
jgi:Tol biopolymer transport system component